MQYTTFGRTGLRVSVAGFGTGGFSRCGLRAGKTEDEAARLILDAVDLGINVIDTAPGYGTEGVVGRALKSLRREEVVVATKVLVRGAGAFCTPAQFVASLDKSLLAMGTDYVDVFNLHAVEPEQYVHARDVLGPALLEQKAKGKIRHIGFTENPIVDFTHETIKLAANDPLWDVYMVGFHMLHQNARRDVFPQTRAKGIGTLMMFAVRSIFADPPRIAREMKAMADQGLVDRSLGDSADPLGFLVHEAGAANVIEAAYRFVRHEPGVDVTLFGTGDTAHLRTNVASLLKPPLPAVDRDKLVKLFGHLQNGVGLDGHGGGGARR